MKTKKQLTNRILSLVLTLVMVLGMLPMSSFTAFAEEIPTEKNIMLGASHIKGTQASNVYFGQYQQSSDGNGNYNFEPIKWRVLSNADGKLFLLSDQNLDVFEYHKEKESVTWETSTMRSWLNGLAANQGNGDDAIDYTSNNFLDTAFSAKEQAAIEDTTVVNDDNGSVDGGNDTTDKVFLLSIAEAENTSYFADDNSRIATNTAYVAGGGEISTIGMNSVGEADYWWLRSPGCHDYCAAHVNSGGVYSYGFVDKDIHAVRPAFNLNLNSVLFTSAANGGKPQGFNAVKKASGNDWKLTLWDSRRAFAVSDTTAKTVKTGDTLSFGYTGAITDVDEYISAMLVDANGEVVYYGQLAQPTAANGTVTFDVPSDMEGGHYTLKLFNERINGDHKTDYSSNFVDIALTVIPTATVSFDANGGTDTMNAVKVEKNSDYTLPANGFTAPRGYQFKGWATTQDGTVITDTKITVINDTTLYAQWTPVYWTDKGNYDISWYTNNSNASSYTISDGADLAGLAVLVNGMHGQTATTFEGKMITISAEIDLSAYLWKPIGCDSSHYFSGTFNGNNQTITGMMVNETNAELNGVGLFGRSNGMIRELTVTNSTVVSDGYHTGGIVGYLENTNLLNCSYSGTVTGASIVGGLVGTPYNSNVHKCTNYATVTVTGTDGKAGGIAGDSMGYIDNCANFGEIKGTNTIGGIAGRISYGSVKNGYSIGAVSATNDDYVGGIAAYVNPSSYGVSAVENCYYLDSTATAGLYSANAAFKAGVFAKTADVFKSGEVAWLLNGSVDGGSNWYQNLDNGKAKDDYPVLLSTNGKVYQFITYAQCDKGDTDPVITYSNSDTSDVVPEHVYQYKATDNVITETCKNCKTHYETAAIIIDPSLDLVYTDAEHKPATVKYSGGWLGGTLTVTYENNINAGTDTAKAIIEKDGEIAIVTFDIKQATNEWTTAPTISGWTYGEEAYTPNYEAKFGNGDVVVTYAGKTSGGEDYAESTTPPTETGNYTATFTVAETNNYSGLTETKEFTISAASIKNATVAVADVAYTGKEQKPTVTVTLGVKTLTENTDYTVSYSDNTDLGTATVTVTGKGNYTDSARGNFEIDYLATDSEAAVSGTQGANGWYIGTVTLSAPAEHTISKTVNGEYTDTVSYDAEQNETVTYYLRNTSDEIAEKSVKVMIDKTAPVAEYQIGTNGWKQFINTITFGLFCKDYKTVEINYSDNLSGVAEKQYYIANGEVTDLSSIDWPNYTEKLNLDAIGKYFIYMRVVDNAGHEVILNTEGIVIYEDSIQVTESVSTTYKAGTDTDVTVELNGNTVNAIKNGDDVLTAGTDYSVSDDKITLKASYLNTLNIDTYTFTVSYNPMGEENSGVTDLTTTFTVKVEPISIAGATVNVSGTFTYNGNAQTPEPVVVLNGETLVKDQDYTVSYADNVNAGTATVTVTGTGNYGGTANGSFVIKQAELTNVSVQQNGKLTYNGKAQAAIVTKNATAITNQEVEFKYSKDGSSYADSMPTFTEAGTYMVYYMAYILGGNYYTCYGEFTVTIDKAIVTEPTIASKPYNGSAQAADVPTSDLYTVEENNGGTGVLESGKGYNVVLKLTDSANYKWSTTDEAEVTLSFKITRATNEWKQTPSIEGWTYGETAKAPVYEAMFGDVTVLYSGTSFDGTDWSGETAPTKAGNYTATFTVDETPDYSGLSEQVSFTIAKKAVTVTANNASKTYGDSDPTLTYTHTELVGSDALVIIVARAIGENANTYTITASQAEGANPNYDITFKTGTFTINKAALTVTVEDKTATYGDAVPNYTVKYEGFVSGDYKDDLGGTLAFDCNYAQFSDKGEYTIKASGYTSDNYNINYADGKLTVNAKPITVTVQNATSVYGDEVAELKATDNGIVNGDKDVYSLATTATSTSDVGKYAITGIALDGNYDITFANEEDAYEITKREITITVEAKNTIVNTALPTYTCKVEGLLDGDEFITEPTLNSDADITVIGEYDITATGADTGDNYSIKYVPAKLTVLTDDAVDAAAGYSEELKDYDPATVTSEDKDELDEILNEINTILDDENITDNGKKALEEVKEQVEKLIKEITDAADATDTENTEKVEDVTTENVTPENKTDLEKAKEDLEKALDEHGSNMTEDEKKAIEDEIKRIDDALEVIGNVEAVEELIDKLPDTIKKDDEAAIKAADDAYNALSDYEKSLVDKDAKKALDDAKATLVELNKPADSNSPATGDNSNMFLWIALLFISGGAVITLTVVDRKRRTASKR